MAVRARKAQANYLNVSTRGTEKYVLMGAGFTELNESPSAQTTSKRYINDKSATKSITGYDWSTPFTTDQIRDEEAVEFICNIGEMQLIGSDAETDYIIVDLDKKASSTNNEFRARKFKVAVEVSEFGNEDGEMTASGNLLGVGDIVIGTFNTETQIFTEGFNPIIGELVVNSSEGSTSGKTKISVTPSLTVGNTYKYKVDTSVEPPLLNEVCNLGYTSWDGTQEITATSGQEILILELDSINRAQKAGKAIIASKV